MTTEYVMIAEVIKMIGVSMFCTAIGWFFLIVAACLADCLSEFKYSVVKYVIYLYLIVFPVFTGIGFLHVAFGADFR